MWNGEFGAEKSTKAGGILLNNPKVKWRVEYRRMTNLIRRMIDLLLYFLLVERD